MIPSRRFAEDRRPRFGPGKRNESPVFPSVRPYFGLRQIRPPRLSARPVIAFPAAAFAPEAGHFLFRLRPLFSSPGTAKAPRGSTTGARTHPHAAARFSPIRRFFPANRTERSPQPTAKRDSFRTAYVRRRHESPVGIIFSGTAPFFFHHGTSGSFLSRRTGAGNPNGLCAGPGAEKGNRTNRSGSSVRKGFFRHGSRTKTRLCFHFGRKIVTFAGKRGLSGKMREKKRAASPREPADGSDSNTQTT